MILCDTQIIALAERGMITPFVRRSVNRIEDRRVLSFGVSSYGYDLRLSPQDFQIFQRPPGEIIDPKCFKPTHLRQAELHEDENGQYFILPANSYGLGVAVERLALPSNVIAICLGKSTYARVGIIANVTPAEPGWRGHLTLEFSNSCASDCKLYANEGIVQMLFLRGERCDVSYGDRNGKYQNQQEQVVLAR